MWGGYKVADSLTVSKNYYAEKLVSPFIFLHHYRVSNPSEECGG